MRIEISLIGEFEDVADFTLHSPIYTKKRINELLFPSLKTCRDIAVPIANVNVVKNMTPQITTFCLLFLFAPSYGKRCSSKTSDIVKVTIRNETRKEAGKDPVEEVFELKM